MSYQHLIFTAERKFWRCVESGEPPMAPRQSYVRQPSSDPQMTKRTELPDEQFQANRRNAGHSTGLATEEGKQR